MPDEFVYHSDCEQRTHEFGVRLGQSLRPGLTVALDGQLGAGKTHLVRAVCSGLGADTSLVNSPTFVLLQCYTDGRLPVFHFDTYRLSDVDEFLAIGADEYLSDPDAVCFVEWADRFGEVLPADRLSIRIEHTGPTSRSVHVSSTGPVSDIVLNSLREQVS